MSNAFIYQKDLDLWVYYAFYGFVGAEIQTVIFSVEESSFLMQIFSLVSHSAEWVCGKIADYTFCFSLALYLHYCSHQSVRYDA